MHTLLEPANLKQLPKDLHFASFCNSLCCWMFNHFNCRCGFYFNRKKMARQSSHAFLRKMRRCREKETEVARGTIHQRLAQGNGFFCRSCARVLQCQFGSAEPQSPTFLCTDCLCAVSLKRALARFRGILGLPNAGSVEPHFSESRFPL